VAVLLIGLILVFRHPIDTYVLAQFIGTMLLLQVGAFYLLLKRQDLWAGILFAFSTIPPTISAPLAIFILIIYAARGRWRGLATFLIVLLSKR
jgi:hypothetical protein